MTYTFNRPAFPATRMRRIRKNDQLRQMVSETQLGTQHLIYPVFLLDGKQQRQDIPSMPNVQRLSADLFYGFYIRVKFENFSRFSWV